MDLPPINTTVELDFEEDGAAPVRLTGIVASHAVDPETNSPVAEVRCWRPNGVETITLYAPPEMLTVVDGAAGPQVTTDLGALMSVVDLSAIKVPERLVREFREDNTFRALMSKLARDGKQDQPLSLDTPEGMTLVDGLHRLVAMRRLGWTRGVVRYTPAAAKSEGLRFLAGLMENHTTKPMHWVEVGLAAADILDKKTEDAATHERLTVMDIADRCGIARESLAAWVAAVRRLGPESRAYAMDRNYRDLRDDFWCLLVRAAKDDIHLRWLEKRIIGMLKGGAHVNKKTIRELARTAAFADKARMAREEAKLADAVVKKIPKSPEKARQVVQELANKGETDEGGIPLNDLGRAVPPIPELTQMVATSRRRGLERADRAINLGSVRLDVVPLEEGSGAVEIVITARKRYIYGVSGEVGKIPEMIRRVMEEHFMDPTARIRSHEALALEIEERAVRALMPERQVVPLKRIAAAKEKLAKPVNATDRSSP